MNLRTPRQRFGRAFTLVELMVVVAVIGIIASLLLPALSRAKFKAQNSVCLNNIRQLGLAVAAYTSTSADGELPPYVMRTSSAPTQSGVATWLHLIGVPMPLQGSRTTGHFTGIFRCPLYQGTIRTGEHSVSRAPFVGTVQHATSYGYNAWGVGGYWNMFGLGGYADKGSMLAIRAQKESSIAAPSDMITLGDAYIRSQRATADASFSGAWYIIAPKSGWGEQPSPVGPRKQPSYLAHRARANRLFFDLHAEAERLDIPFTASNESLRRWNVDNQPHKDHLGPH